jgi:hypothetical protein
MAGSILTTGPRRMNVLSCNGLFSTAAILNLKLRHFCLALGQAVSGAWRYIRKWREMGTPVEREPAILLGSKPDEIGTGPG